MNLERIHVELERRQCLLVKWANDPAMAMDPLDRRCIGTYFERGEAPPRPATEADILKTLFTSCCTYYAVRNHLRSLMGGLVYMDTLPEALATSLDAPELRDDATWSTTRLASLAARLHQRQGFDLHASSLPVRARITAFLLTGAQEMGTQLQGGLGAFYAEVDAVCDEGALAMWSFVTKLSKPIRFVGPALTCDFLKNCGFVRFVKVDHHLAKEFPALVGDDCAKAPAKEHFLRSLGLADQLDMTPFHLDHLLYQWGRHKRLAAMGEQASGKPGRRGTDQTERGPLPNR